MEMRVKKQLEFEKEISFSDFEVEMLISKEEGDGVVLINEQEEEKYFRRNQVEDLFYIINRNNIKKISYIKNEFNSIKINQFFITLLNDEKFIVELL